MIHQFFRLSIFILSFFILFTGCSQKSKNSVYVVGRDPTWYPLDLMGKENYVYGFSTDLMIAIAEEEDLTIELVKAGWNQLIPGLKNRSFSGVFSSMTPSPINDAHFDFSKSFLDLGPVLVVPLNSPYRSLEDLKEKVVGVSEFNNDVLIVQKIPSIVIKPYDSLGQALEDLSRGRIDGAVMGKLIAETYLRDLYRDRLKIVTPPLNDKGLRLMVLHDHEPELIESFNRGLEILKQNQTYLKLLHKWNLD